MADTAWVGRISPEAIAAVSTCFFASWTLFAIGDILVAGLTALVSQAVGSRRDEEASVAVATAMVLSLGLGVIVAAIGWFGSPFLFRALLSDPEIVEMGTRYFQIFSLLAPLFYLDFSVEALYRSCGDSKTPMLVLLVGTILNILIDPLFIFGWGPIPRMEVAGAAVATAISQVVVILVYIALYLRNGFPLPVRLRRAFVEFSTERARQIFRIGMPTALVGILFSVVYLSLARITGAFGAAALAAMGIVNRIESLTYLSTIAVGNGVATLVGQNLGAGHPDRAEAAAHHGALIATGIAGTMMILFFTVPEPIARLFTSDSETIREAVAFLRIVGISQVMMGWELVYGQAFTGAGDTMPPMWVSVSTSVVRIPMAWYLSEYLGWGPAGIWWTISSTGVVRGLWATIWFRRGHWKKKALLAAAPPPGTPPPRGAEGPEG